MAPNSANTEVARLIGVTIALVVLSQSPLLAVKYNEVVEGHAMKKHVSPLEVVAISAEDVLPSAMPLIRVVMLPGTWFKQASFSLSACAIGRNSTMEDACSWSRVTDVARIWQATDTSKLAELWRAQVTDDREGLISMSCAVIVLGGLASSASPVVIVAVGFGMLAATITQKTSCEVLPTLWLMILLSLLMIMFHLAHLSPTKASLQARSRRGAGTRQAAGAPQAAGAAAASGTPSKGDEAPSPSSGAARKRRTGRI